MDLQEAQLIRRVLEKLTGSKGKSPQQLANECGISARRATYLLMCLEKAGLVLIDSAGKVSLSDEMARTVWNHVDRLLHGNGSVELHRKSPWMHLRAAIALFQVDAASHGQFTAAVFNEIFGRKSK